MDKVESEDEDVMSWRFSQSAGQLTAPDNVSLFSAYAGRGKGRNNPALQDVRGGERLMNGIWVAVYELDPTDWGPLPRGKYIINSPIDTPKHGPFVMWLTPDPGNEMFGRSEFGVHGDSLEHPGLASEGCIVTPRVTRERIWNSGDREIEVVF